MTSEEWTVVAFCIPLTIFTIVSNILFIITLLKTSSLHTPSNTLICAMCVTDLIAGFLCQPLYFSLLLSKHGYSMLILGKTYDITFRVRCFNSFIFSLLITCDRYAAICYPFRYLELATCRKYVNTSLSILALSVIYAMIAFKFHDTSEVTFWFLEAGLQFIIIMAVLMMYARIYKVILSQRKRVVSMDDTLARQSRISRIEQRRTLTVSIILATLIACYAPYTVYSIRGILFFLRIVDNHSIYLFYLSNYFVLLNSCLNPMIYCAKSQEIRNAAVRVFMPNSRWGTDSRNATANALQSRTRRTDQRIATSEL